MSDLSERLQEALGDTYSLTEELGGGGMSRVFRATEIKLGRQVVIKVLPPDMSAGVNKERFEREIKLAASLQHPHVVPLLTAGQVDGDLLYYVMPFIEGESLRVKLAREGELPIGEALRILREVVDALSYAHQHDVVHRDIKPDNVMLTGNHAVVTDFGVAKAVSASSGGTASSLTSLGIALGTPAYMSPEQAAADPLVDHRADIYAVGALAYEMLSGRPPFVKQTPQQVLAAQVSEAPEPITTHRDAVSPALADLIMRCLAKRAADRWQTAEELRVQFESMATPQSGGVTPTSTQPVAAVSSVHTPVRVAALFGVAAAVALALTYGAVIVLGLPDWVFLGAVLLLAIGLPIVLMTGKQERARAEAATTGMQLATPTGLERHFTWKKSILGGVGGFVGLAVVAGGFMAMRLSGVGPFGTLVASGALDEQARIVLADFENTSADSSLGPTVTDLFRIDLSESPIINLLSSAQVSAVLTRMERSPDTELTPDVASEVAIREGVKAYLTGEIRSLGEAYILSARLVNAETREDLVSIREQADNSAGIIDAVDRLATAIRERVGESFSSLRADPPLARFTTSSLSALQLYQQGSREFDAGNTDRAIALLQEAVAVDSNFAMAWRRMGSYMGNPGVGMADEGREALRRAYLLRERLSERERYHVEALYSLRVEPNTEQVITSYLAILEKYPNDEIALNNLGTAYSQQNNLPEAERWYGEAIRRGVALPLTYQNRLNTQWNQGRYESADSTLTIFETEYPGHPGALNAPVMMAAARGRYDEALDAVDSMLARHGTAPDREAAGYNQRSAIAYVRGQFREGTRWNRERLVVNSEKRGLFARAERPLRDAADAAERALWYGVDPPSVRDIDDLWERTRAFDPDRPQDELPWEDFIDLYLIAESPERARELLDGYEAALGETGRQRERRDLGLFAGRLNTVDDPAAAVPLFRTVLDEPGGGRNQRREVTWNMAEAFRAAGQADSAIYYFEEALNFPVLASVFWDARFLPPTLIRLGELYEDRDPEKAAEYYGRFVDLWENADPELQPQVRDVRGRIARLVGERPSN